MSHTLVSQPHSINALRPVGLLIFRPPYRVHDTIREAVLTCAQKLTQLNLLHGTKKSGKEKKVKPMADMLRSIGITVRGIREVSPEEEKKRFKPGVKE